MQKFHEKGGDEAFVKMTFTEILYSGIRQNDDRRNPFQGAFVKMTIAEIFSREHSSK